MNVRFFAGTKAEYLALAKHNPIALYFCRDTRELFWGDRLLSDGIRVVPTKNDLPSLSAAADGIIYYVADSRNGYVMSPDRSSWVQAIYAPTTDINVVPESEAHNVAVSVAALREIENTIYEKIASIDALNRIKVISFAGVDLTKVDGVFSIDRDTARKALGLSFTEGSSESEVEIVATKDYVDRQIAAIPAADLKEYAKKTDLDGLATEEFVNKKIAEVELNDKDVDLEAYYTKTEVDALIPDTTNYVTKDDLPSVEGLASEEYVDKKFAEIKVPAKVSELENDAGYLTEHQDLSGYVTQEELKGFISEIPDEYVTDDELAAKGYLTEHQDLSPYAKTQFVTNTAVAQKYEVLPIDGMLISYRENEVRLNTQRVVPTPQAVGSTGNPNMYYATFRAYAPEGATGVIESDGTQTDTEPTALATDTFGRKYTTIWSAIAVKNGDKWTKWGDNSKLDKYIGFYYTFKWYKEDELIGTDKVRVILTNDACHDDLVPDAVARRIDEKVATVKIPEGLATEQFVLDKVAEITTDYLKEVPAEYITETELDARGFLTEHQDLRDYAKKADIPSIAGLASEDFVRSEIAKAELNSGEVTEEELDNLLANYYKKNETYNKTEVDNKIDSIQIPSLDGLATEDFVKEQISDFVTHDELTAVETKIPSIDGLASESYVDEAVANIPTADLTGYATEDFVRSEIKNIVFPEADLSNCATKEALEDVRNSIPSIDGLASEQFVSEAIDNIKIPDVSNFITIEEVEAKGYITEVPTEYVTETELSEKGFITEHQSLADYAKKSDIPSLEGYAKTEDIPEVPTKVSELQNDAGYLTEVPATDLSGYYNKQETEALLNSAAAEIEAKIPSLDGYAKTEDIPTDYLTRADLEGYSKFSGSYNDLTDVPEIPSIEGLATEQYVEEAVKNVTIDTSNLATLEQLTVKADDIPFADDQFVSVPIGNFVLGESVKGLTVAQIFAKLLGLGSAVQPEEPEIPVEPTGIVDKIIANRLPMYSVTADAKLAEVPFNLMTLTSDEAAAEPSVSGFYQIKNANGTVIESGYQELQADSDAVYYVIALPKEIDFTTIVSVQAYSVAFGKWMSDDTVMISDSATIAALCDEVGIDISHIDQNVYTIWAIEDCPTGRKLRFIINE